jgi:hypothetical protein
MLNFASGRLARLRYLPGSFKLLQEGDHVLCAVTGRAIPLNDLRYWSHELQEAYVSAEVAVGRYGDAKAKKQL